MGTLGYYQLHIDTIIKKYCINKTKPKLQCNGKCYLSQQLRISQESNATDQKGGHTIVEAFFPIFFQESNTTTIKPPITGVLKTYWTIASSYSLEFVDIIDPPPQFLNT